MEETNTIEPTEIDMIEELHTRIDTLLDILEKKEILTKEEFENKFNIKSKEKEN